MIERLRYAGQAPTGEPRERLTDTHKKKSEVRQQDFACGARGKGRSRADDEGAARVPPAALKTVLICIYNIATLCTQQRQWIH